MQRNIHSSKGTIPCPKCKENACIHHMQCHYCKYVLRYDDVWGEGDDN